MLKLNKIPYISAAEYIDIACFSGGNKYSGLKEERRDTEINEKGQSIDDGGNHRTCHQRGVKTDKLRDYRKRTADTLRYNYREYH